MHIPTCLAEFRLLLAQTKDQSNRGKEAFRHKRRYKIVDSRESRATQSV